MNQGQTLQKPLAGGMLDKGGAPIPASGNGAEQGYDTVGLNLTEGRQTFRFDDVPVPPVVSLNRGFSAPVILRGRPDGAGYRLLADRVLELDPLNPQVAARLLPPLGRWRRFDADRQALMRTELDRILATDGLSPDVFEIASKAMA